LPRRAVAAAVAAATVLTACGGPPHGSAPGSPPAPSGRFVVISPGPVLDVLGNDSTGRPVIQVTGRATNSTPARLEVTTVDVGPPITGSAVVAARRRSGVEVVPYEQVYGPPGGALSSAGAAGAASSIDTAIAAAACALGYPESLAVLATDPAARTARVLKVGDMLVSVDGRRVATVSQLRAVLARHAPTTAEVALRRAGRPTQVTVTLLPADDGSAGARMGVTVGPSCQAPFSVRVNGLDAISGPSMGLVIALGILAKVGNQRLVSGMRVAGTGTVGVDGTVGAVSGVESELAGARTAGDTTFLVPSANCREAQAAPLAVGGIVVRVDTLKGAWQALLDLQAGRAVPHC
jgi:PDZ domain-containing protein